MAFAKKGNGAVVDEFIRPPDSDDWSGDALSREVLDDGAAEAVVENVVFESADHIAAAGEEFDGRGVEWFDPAGVDHGGFDAVVVAEFIGGFEREIDHVPEADQCHLLAVSDHFGFADVEQLGLVFDGGAIAGASGVADGDRAVVVVGDGPEHIDEFVFVPGLHVDEIRDVAKVADVEEAVVGGAIVAGESGAVHADGDVEFL